MINVQKLETDAQRKRREKHVRRRGKISGSNVRTKFVKLLSKIVEAPKRPLSPNIFNEVRIN